MNDNHEQLKDAYKKLSTPEERFEDILDQMEAMLALLDPEKLRGKDGKTPTRQDLEQIIAPLIPRVRDGHTPSESELKALIIPLIPKVEDGEDGKDGSPDTAAQIRDKLKSLKGKDRLSVFDLKDLEWLRTQQQPGNVIGGNADTGGGMYTPQGVTTATVGGIDSGTNLGTIPVTIQSILDAMLYPPNIPTTTLNTTPPGGIYEIGDVISSVDLASTTTPGSLPITTFEFKKNGSTIFTDPTPAPGGGTETYTDGTGVSSNTVYQAFVGDGVNIGSASVAFTFVSAYYYGSAAPGLDISADGGGLTKLVIGNSPTLTESFSPTVEVYYYAYPSSYPALTSILDKNGFETIADWTVTLVNVTNSFGNVVEYRQYEFNNLTTQVNFNNTFIQ